MDFDFYKDRIEYRMIWYPLEIPKAGVYIEGETSICDVPVICIKQKVLINGYTNKIEKIYRIDEHGY